VQPGTCLTSDRKWTVEKAANDQLLHMCKDGTILVPPVYLHCLHNLSTRSGSTVLEVLYSFEPLSTTRDNEAMLASMLLFRLKAASLIGKKRITLHELHLVTAEDPLARATVTIMLFAVPRQTYRR
jgi:hypothetical protein